MSAFRDMSGQKFGRLTLLYRVENSPGTPCHPRGSVQYKCRCDCGNELVVRYGDIASGHTRSCGCIQKEFASSLNFVDLTGRRFGRLTVIKLVGHTKGQKALWLCKCDCGGSTITTSDCLSTGNSQSCGCLQRERTSAARRKWTDFENLILGHYDEMYQRCCNPKNPNYFNYGGRGIYICEEWLNKETGRKNFVEWSKTHGFSKELSINRIDNDGPYAPWNCEWTTDDVQANNKRNNIRIEINGVNRTLHEWSKIVHINHAMLRDRYYRNKEKLISFLRDRCQPHIVCINPASLLLAQAEKEVTTEISNNNQESK